MKEFIKKLKMTYAYYKSLGRLEERREKTNPQPIEKLNIRPDVFAFLTYPGTLECEKKHN